MSEQIDLEVSNLMALIDAQRWVVENLIGLMNQHQKSARAKHLSMRALWCPIRLLQIPDPSEFLVERTNLIRALPDRQGESTPLLSLRQLESSLVVAVAPPLR